MSEELSFAQLSELPENALLTQRQAARLLGISLMTWHRLLKTGVLDESRLFITSPQTPRYWKGRMLALLAEHSDKLKSPVAATQGGSMAWPRQSA